MSNYHSLDIVASQELCRSCNTSGFKIQYAKVFMQHKANPNYRVKGSGDAPLHLLARLGERPDICQLMIEHGADVNLRNGSGETALMIACNSTSSSSSRLAIVRLFLQQPTVQIDALDNAGHCACLHAVLQSNVWILRELLMAGASVKLNRRYSLTTSPDLAATPGTPHRTSSDSCSGSGDSPSPVASPTSATAPWLKSCTSDKLLSPYDAAKAILTNSITNANSMNTDTAATPPLGMPNAATKTDIMLEEERLKSTGGRVSYKSASSLRWRLLWAPAARVCYEMVLEAKEWQDDKDDIENDGQEFLDCLNTWKDELSLKTLGSRKTGDTTGSASAPTTEEGAPSSCASFPLFQSPHCRSHSDVVELDSYDVGSGSGFLSGSDSAVCLSASEKSLIALENEDSLCL